MNALNSKDKKFCEKNLKIGEYVTLTMLLPLDEISKFLEILNKAGLKYGALASVNNKLKFYKNDPNEEENA